VGEDHAPPDSSIDITLRNLPEAAIEVRDRGPGFPQEEMSNLTERFARGSNSSGTIGSGLGLTIARDVAQAHGGRLTLGNHPEGGACVILSL